MRSFSEDETIKKFKETERSIISIDINTNIMLDLLIIIPSKLMIKRINGNTNKEYTIPTLILLLLIRKLNLGLVWLETKEEISVLQS